jgi:hypothetical protein
MPAVAGLLGVAVLAIAVFDYASSPQNNRGIRVGPIFLSLPNHAPVANGQKGKPPVSRPPTGAGVPPGSTPSGGTPWTGAGLKPPIAGLLDRKGAPASAFYGVVGGYVVNVNWASLQSAAGGPITNGNAIDQALAQVRAANAKGVHLVLKLRVFAGIGAPNWAKSIGGAPFAMQDPNTPSASGTIGRFWLPAYGQAYQDLQNKLAARYDAVPEIREIAIARCTTIFMEPFLRGARSATNVAHLLAAGYSVAADQACEQQQVQAHAVWLHTRSDLSFNPMQVILGPGRTGTDERFTEQMMSYCRQTLGARCVLENNSLRSTSLGSLYDQMYNAMRSLGPNIVFQTAQMATIGSLSSTLVKAVQLHATSVELPAGYQNMGPAAFGSFRLQLAANALL